MKIYVLRGEGNLQNEAKELIGVFDTYEEANDFSYFLKALLHNFNHTFYIDQLNLNEGLEP